MSILIKGAKMPKMMKRKRIRACPFCGKEAHTFQVPENTPGELATHPEWRWRYPGMWLVGCYTEGCMGDLNHFTMVFLSEEDAIEAWNKRAGEAE